MVLNSLAFSGGLVGSRNTPTVICNTLYMSTVEFVVNILLL